MALMNMKDQEAALLDAYLNVDKGQETAEALMTKASSSQENFITRFYDSLLSKSGDISKQDLPPVSTQPAIQVDPAEIEEFMQIYNNGVMQQMYDNDMGGLGSDAPDPLGNMGVPPARLVPVDDLGLDNPEPLFKLFDDIKNENIKKEELPDILGSLLGAGLRRRDSSFVGGEYETASTIPYDVLFGTKDKEVDMSPKAEAGDQLSLSSEEKVVKEAEEKGETDNPVYALAKGMVEGKDIATKRVGITPEMWEKYKKAVAKIESGAEKEPYRAKGGANDHYDGKYQMGKVAKADAAQLLGITLGHSSAQRADFRSNAGLQEKAFAAYTAKNHSYLMNKSKEYRALPIEEKLAVLGYAHNQGWAGAKTWLKTGKVGKDAFGTAGDKYSEAIAKSLNITPSWDLVKDRKSSPRPVLRPKGLMEQ